MRISDWIQTCALPILPLIVHARDADDDTVAVLKEEHAKGAFPGVIHCFTAGPELARAALEIGFYISLAGIVTFKSAEALRETVREVPRSEEHTSELQSLMRISYAVFCLKKQKLVNKN